MSNNNPSDNSSQFMPFPKSKANLAMDRKRQREEALQKQDAKIIPDTSNVPPAFYASPAVNSMAATFGATPVHRPVSANIPATEAEIKNPSLLSLDLPSSFLFYPFKELRVELIKGLHQAKFARAAETRNLQTLVEAVSATIGTQGVTAFDLTVPDFYWVLYWHKLNSFTKAKFTLTTECENPAHIQEVVKGTKPKESLTIQAFVNKSSMVETKLDKIPELEDPVGMPEGVYLKPALMRDVVEYIDHPNQDEPGFQLLGQFATMIAVEGQDTTFEQRLQMIESMTADQIQTIRDYETVINQYGIEETMVVKCKECGASKVAKLSIDAFSFLPA